MQEKTFEFKYTLYDAAEELSDADKWLLNEARKVTEQAYAPYSNFHVGAVARLVNGEIVRGSNQENASFPAGICAERVLLSVISSLFPHIPIDTIAVSYNSKHIQSNHPISPCGLCRQSLQEFEGKTKHPIKLLLGGMEGAVIEIASAAFLLPLAFTSEELL